MKRVLAATVQVKDWDERFSRDNRAWASIIAVPEDADKWGDRRAQYTVDRSHSVLTDAFITAFRREIQQERKPIREQLRRPVQSASAPKKPRERNAEK